MRTTSLLRAIPKSFYSRELYQEIRHEWSGFGFGYLFVAIFAVSIPLVLMALLYSSTVTLDKPYDANYIINQVPQLDIRNGEISTKATMPYYIKEKETGRTMVIIDTTRPVTDWSQQMKDYKVLAIIGKNQVLINKKPDRGEKTLYDIPQDTNMVVTSDVVRGWAETVISYGWIAILIVAPLVILIWFVCSIVATFLYGILAKLISILLRNDLSYMDSVRLTSVATTPTLVLFAVASILSLELSGWTYFAINAVYLFFAVRATKHDTI